MFKLDVNNKPIEFSFWHDRDLEHFFVNKHKISNITGCRLVINGEVEYGMAMCSAEDQFCADKGRRLALKDALQQAGLTRDEREAVWVRYFNRGIPNEEYADVVKGEQILVQSDLLFGCIL